MILAAKTTSPDTASNGEEALKSTPRATWTRAQENMFCWIVQERKTTGGRGTVARTCEEFGVKPAIYQYWRQRLEDETTNNGAGNGVAAHMDITRANGAPPEETVTENITNAVAADQAVVRSEIGKLMDRIDELALQLEKKKYPQSDVLGAIVLAARLILAQWEKEGVTPDTPKQEEGKPAESAAPAEPVDEKPVTNDAEKKTNDLPAETAQELPPTTAIADQRTTEPRVAPPPADRPLPAASPLPAAEVKTQPAKPQLSRKELAVNAMQSALGISAKYERLVEMTVTECMQRFEAAHPTAKWSDKEEYERHIRTIVANVDGAKCGHIVHHIERTYVSLKARQRNDKHFIGDLSTQYHRRAFALAEARSKWNDLPHGVTYETLKSEAYQAFHLLAELYDTDCGEFWPWAEKQIAASLDAMCGREPVSFFRVREEGKRDERQKTLPEKALERALADQARIRERPQDIQRHRNMISYINGLASEGRVENMQQVLEVIAPMYTADITVLAEQSQTEGVCLTIGDALALLFRSTLKSIWMFDPQRRGASLDEFIRSGWTIALQDSEVR